MAVITAAVVDVGANGQWKASQGTITADKQAWLSTATWNAAVTFTHLKANITDTSSNAASLLMDLQVGGLTKFSVRKDGGVTGTLLTAAQPNVTSVGTLTSLAVSGALTLGNAGVASGVLNSADTLAFNIDSDNSDGTNANYFVWARDTAAVTGGTELMRLSAAGLLTVAVGGLTVSAGTTAVQALTATSATLSADLQLANGFTIKWASAADRIIGNTGTSFVFDLNSVTRFTIGTSGVTCAAGITATTGTFSGAVSLGNTVNAVSPTSPNRTVTIVIGGTTYYLHAKTTND